MKKLYLLLLMLLFIPATNAVTPYRLDQPVFELNGYTLREVFENGNLDTNYPIFTSDGYANIYIRDFLAVQDNYYYVNNSYSVYSNQYEGALGRMSIISQGHIFLSSLTYMQYNNYNRSSKTQYLGLTGNYNITYYGSTGTASVTITNGYIINMTSFGIGHLTIEEMDIYHDLYLEAVRFQNVHDPQSAMSLEFFMISTFFMYLLVMGIGYFTRSKYFYFAGALLWFVPIFNYQNIFIITTSVIVFISHLLIIFYSDKDDVFE